MIGIKAFEKDLTCYGGFQYEIGKTYEHEGDLEICSSGFHFCRTIAQAYMYYPKSEDTRICIVEALGDIFTKDGLQYCTNKIKILEEITEDYIRCGNRDGSSIGYNNSGSNNTGNGNYGSYNEGDYNTGNDNKGDRNSGWYNKGECNSGWSNLGDYNCGHENVGNCNVGDRNIGDCNTGDYNVGSYNVGNGNLGSYNTGSYNKCNFSAGCFNTTSPTVRMFNRDSGITYEDWMNSEAKKILDTITDTRTKWESSGYPEATVNERKQIYWNKLSNNRKQIILDLPNFDADIFKECTGIDVNSK